MTIHTYTTSLTAHAFAIFRSGSSYTVRWRGNRRAIKVCRRIFIGGETPLDLARLWIALLVGYYNGRVKVRKNGNRSEEVAWLFRWADCTRHQPLIKRYVGEEVI